MSLRLDDCDAVRHPPRLSYRHWPGMREGGVWPRLPSTWACRRTASPRGVDRGRVCSPARAVSKPAGAVHWALLRPCGPHGAVQALRQMNRVRRLQRPERAGLGPFAVVPCLGVPVYYILGGRDRLLPERAARKMNILARATPSQVTSLPEARHMAHLDRVAAVRAIMMAAALAQANQGLGQNRRPRSTSRT